MWRKAHVTTTVRRISAAFLPFLCRSATVLEVVLAARDGGGDLCWDDARTQNLWYRWVKSTTPPPWSGRCCSKHLSRLDRYSGDDHGLAVLQERQQIPNETATQSSCNKNNDDGDHPIPRFVNLCTAFVALSLSLSCSPSASGSSSPHRCGGAPCRYC